MKPLPKSPMLTDPLDTLFNTEPADVVQYGQADEDEFVQRSNQPAEKDEEDRAIDAKIDTVYDAALDAYTNQVAFCDIIEPRYSARNAEVAAQYLSIALNAAATRARVKGDRARGAAFMPYANSKFQQNIVVASREDIMKMIVDADVKEIK